MQVAIIGAGYVGLVSGACFADFGHSVTCIEKDEAKVRRLKAGDIPIFEPGLDALVAQNVRAGRLSFAVEADAVRQADAVFIAVGTPSRRGEGHADLSFVYDAAAQVADLLDGFTVIVTKSTVPVGTGDEIERIVRERRPDAQFAVAANPEFLREGAAIEDFKRPDRIVVGADDPRAQACIAELYRPLFLNETPILFTDRRTAELTKYAANAFLAMKVTFINQMADLCERVGADVQHVARGMGLDKRIGGKFLNVGPGYGGSCFPKDTLALVRTARDYCVPIDLIETTVRVNDARKKAMAQRVADAVGGQLSGKRVGVLGLTFKPNTDDMRDAPSLDIIPELLAMGAEVRAFDPAGMVEARQFLPAIEFADSPYETAVDADALVIITEWDQFRALDLGRIRQAMRAPVLIDLRNIYKPEHLRSEGFAYFSIGRGRADVAHVGDDPKSRFELHVPK